MMLSLQQWMNRSIFCIFSVQTNAIDFFSSNRVRNRNVFLDFFLVLYKIIQFDRFRCVFFCSKSCAYSFIFVYYFYFGLWLIFFLNNHENRLEDERIHWIWSCQMWSYKASLSSASANCHVMSAYDSCYWVVVEWKNFWKESYSGRLPSDLSAKSCVVDLQNVKDRKFMCTVILAYVI